MPTWQSPAVVLLACAQRCCCYVTRPAVCLRRRGCGVSTCTILPYGPLRVPCCMGCKHRLRSLAGPAFEDALQALLRMHSCWFQAGK